MTDVKTKERNIIKISSLKCYNASEVSKLRAISQLKEYLFIIFVF